jgi:hypothetical protein
MYPLQKMPVTQTCLYFGEVLANLDDALCRGARRACSIRERGFTFIHILAIPWKRGVSGLVTMSRRRERARQSEWRVGFEGYADAGIGPSSRTWKPEPTSTNPQTGSLMTNTVLSVGVGLLVALIIGGLVVNAVHASAIRRELRSMRMHLRTRREDEK